MPEPLRVAVLSLIHDHVWGNVPNLLRSDGVKVVAAADPHEDLRDKFVDRFSGAEAFTTAEECLDRVKPDAVLVCDSNAGSVPLVELAAAAGCHVVVEKPLANTLAGADRMVAACEAAGVKLIVNWPTAWTPSVWQAARLALSGEFGPIWQTRFHSSHNGPQEIGCSDYFWRWLYDEEANGPGALMDYCCYGAATAAWLLGRPEQVACFAGNLTKDYDVATDNAVMLLRYPHALSLLEASWSQTSNLPRKGLTINCLTAALAPGRDGLLVADAAHPDGRLLPAEPVPAHLANLGDYLRHVLDGGEPEGILDVRVSHLAQAILQAGIDSWRSGQVVTM